MTGVDAGDVEKLLDQEEKSARELNTRLHFPPGVRSVPIHQVGAVKLDA